MYIFFTSLFGAMFITSILLFLMCRAILLYNTITIVVYSIRWGTILMWFTVSPRSEVWRCVVCSLVYDTPVSLRLYWLFNLQCKKMFHHYNNYCYYGALGELRNDSECSRPGLFEPSVTVNHCDEVRAGTITTISGSLPQNKTTLLLYANIDFTCIDKY